MTTKGMKKKLFTLFMPQMVKGGRDSDLSGGIGRIKC